MSWRCLFFGHRWIKLRDPVTLEVSDRICERCPKEQWWVLGWRTKRRP